MPTTKSLGDDVSAIQKHKSTKFYGYIKFYSEMHELALGSLIISGSGDLIYLPRTHITARVPALV